METILALFTAASIQFALPPDLLASLCFVESSYNTQAIHYADGYHNSVGICQIQLRTAQWLGFEGSEKELMEPSNNIYYAAAYLAYQRDRYNSIQKAVIAYNIGHAKNLTTTEYQVRVYRVWRVTNND